MPRKKKITLSVFEAAMAGMKARGVEPSPGTAVAFISIAEALDVPVTVEQDAQTETAKQEAVAKSAEKAIEETKLNTKAELAELERRRRQIEIDGTLAVRKLAAEATSAKARLQKVSEVLSLLNSA